MLQTTILLALNHPRAAGFLFLLLASLIATPFYLAMLANRITALANQLHNLANAMTNYSQRLMNRAIRIASGIILLSLTSAGAIFILA